MKGSAPRYFSLNFSGQAHTGAHHAQGGFSGFVFVHLSAMLWFHSPPRRCRRELAHDCTPSFPPFLLLAVLPPFSPSSRPASSPSRRLFFFFFFLFFFSVFRSVFLFSCRCSFLLLSFLLCCVWLLVIDRVCILLAYVVMDWWCRSPCFFLSSFLCRVLFLSLSLSSCIRATSTRIVCKQLGITCNHGSLSLLVWNSLVRSSFCECCMWILCLPVC